MGIRGQLFQQEELSKDHDSWSIEFSASKDRQGGYSTESKGEYGTFWCCKNLLTEGCKNPDISCEHLIIFIYSKRIAL